MTDLAPAPDTVIPIVRPEPILRAQTMAYVRFRRRDPESMDRFLTDFGLLPTGDGRAVRHYRGCGAAPFLVGVESGEDDAFLGFGVTAESAEDLHNLADAAGLKVTPHDGPGGGLIVRLTDPDGLAVDVVYGATPAEPLPAPTQLAAVNTPIAKRRVNAGVRPPLQPSPIYKLGHVVLQRPDFDRAAQWYMRHLGLIPSDVQVLASGAPVLGFFRFDRGCEPTDHHSVALLGAPATGLLHAAFETFDLEAVGQGHQYLRARGWTPYWGVGRHALGSQVFDYWKDSVGDEWEHYADGDVLDASQPTGYLPLSRGSLWTWGDDLPDSMRPGMPLEAIPAIHADGGFGDMPLERVEQLMAAMSAPPRPWMR